MNPNTNNLTKGAVTLSTAVGLHWKCPWKGVESNQNASRQCQFLKMMYLRVWISFDVMCAFKSYRHNRHVLILINSNANKYPRSPPFMKWSINDISYSVEILPTEETGLSASVPVVSRLTRVRRTILLWPIHCSQSDGSQNDWLEQDWQVHVYCAGQLFYRHNLNFPSTIHTSGPVQKVGNPNLLGTAIPTP